MPQHGYVRSVEIVMRGDIERRRTHADKRAQGKIDQMAKSGIMVGRSGNECIDLSGQGIDQTRGKENEQGRPDEEPRPSLEYFPPVADGRPCRKLHGDTIARALILAD